MAELTLCTGATARPGFTRHVHGQHVHVDGMSMCDLQFAKREKGFCYRHVDCRVSCACGSASGLAERCREDSSFNGAHVLCR